MAGDEENPSSGGGKKDVVIPGKACGLCCAYFIPPLGIFWQFGCGVEFLISLILTFCGYFPGLIYACIMIATDKGGS